MTRPLDPAPNPPRRRKQKEETRQRLVDAALEILRTEGEAAVTTVRLTQAAGIVQSGFYKHFESTEACLEAAADSVLETLRGILREIRHSLPPGPIDPAVLAGNAERDLRAFLADPAVAEILVCARYTPSILGRSVARFVRAIVDELTQDLWLYARRRRVPVEEYPRVALFAELIIAQYLQCVDALVSKRHQEIGPVARVLAESIASAAPVLLPDRRR